MSTPAEYFQKMVPEAWNRRLQEQEERGADGAELLGKMRATRLSLAIIVPDDRDYHLKVCDGQMSSVAAPDPDVLLSLALGVRDCQKLEASVGASPMALLGGVGGIPDFVLTPERINMLREIDGTLRVQVTGDDAWGVTIHFGAPPVPDPGATVSVAQQEFARLIAGELDLQGAFMTGKLAMEGNVEIPMKLAMAIMSPE